MDRRAFLASCVAGSVGLTAGCGALAESRSTIALQQRAVERTDGGTVKRVTYGTPEQALLTVALSQPIARASVTDEFQLGLRLAARDSLADTAGDVTFAVFRCRLRAPRAAATAPATIYVAPPSKPGTPGLETKRTAAGWTAVSTAAPVDVDRLPLVLPTRVDPEGAEVETVSASLRTRLETPERVYTLDDRLSFRPAVSPRWDPAPTRGGGSRS